MISHGQEEAEEKGMEAEEVEECGRSKVGLGLEKKTRAQARLGKGLRTDIDALFGGTKKREEIQSCYEIFSTISFK